MDTSGFYTVSVGASPQEVVAACGEPFAIHKKSNGTVEYEYIERLTIGARNVNERHFFIIMRDGKVIAKRVGSESPNSFGFDSYEMQTTQKNS